MKDQVIPLGRDSGRIGVEGDTLVIRLETCDESTMTTCLLKSPGLA